MTYMRSWKSLRLTSHTWLGLNPQIGRPLSRIVVPFYLCTSMLKSMLVLRKTIIVVYVKNVLIELLQKKKKKKIENLGTVSKLKILFSQLGLKTISN
jgi:hypothetical protein